MEKLSADFIYDPIKGDFLRNHLLIMDGDKVVDLIYNNLSEKDVEYYEGILCPGFINTHCHLELSHLRGLIPSGTGLIDFISKVLDMRSLPEEQILEAIKAADHEMYENGIVAVGDISNTIDTAKTKAESLINYYTFVELFDLMDDGMTSSAIAKGKDVYEKHIGKKSLVPHAPYSVSRELFNFLRSSNELGKTISIHNQETPDENSMFRTGDGLFYDFYRKIGIPLDQFSPGGTNSIDYAIENMDPKQTTLFVHNTMTSDLDIQRAHSWSDKIYWATCPNANLYIENRLPDYQCFVNNDAQVTIGTDSLSSNWQLSIWEEVKTIKKYNSHLPLELILKWATINGSKALGFDDSLGSFERGKTPGVLLISNYNPLMNDNVLNGECKRLNYN